MTTCLEDPTKFEYNVLHDHLTDETVLKHYEPIINIDLTFSADSGWSGCFDRRTEIGSPNLWYRFFYGITPASLHRLEKLMDDKVLIQHPYAAPDLETRWLSLHFTVNRKEIARLKDLNRRLAAKRAAEREAAQKAWDEALDAEARIEAEEEELATSDAAWDAIEEEQAKWEAQHETIPFDQEMTDRLSGDWDAEQAAIAAAEISIGDDEQADESRRESSEAAGADRIEFIPPVERFPAPDEF